MTHFTGTIGRECGTLTEHSDSGGDMALVVSPAGLGEPIRFHGDRGGFHWRGEIAVDRKSWRMTCRFGFTVSGTCRWGGERGVYLLDGQAGDAPALYALPGEALA